jgi:outer membrane protein OmpA-like peptidoglycan-associated protein
VRRLSQRAIARALVLAFGVGLGGSAHAQAVANPSRPAIDVGRNLLDVESADVGAQHEWSVSALTTYARGAFVLRSHAGITVPYAPTSRVLVQGQTFVHVLGTYSLTRWLQLGMDVPIIVQQSGESQVGRADPSALDPGAGIGDLRLQAKLHLAETRIDADWGRISVATTLDFAVPSGRDDTMQSSGGSFAPRAIVVWDTSFGARAVVNVGYTWRGDTRVLNVSVPNGFAWELGFEIPIVDRARIMLTVVDDQAREASAGLAAHVADVELQGSFSVGLTDSAATPAWRIGGGLTFRPGLGAPSDRDGDGIIDTVDHCGADVEDVDGFEDMDGCPEDDNDADGVLDADDRCGSMAEDADGFEDADGCPDDDNDHDGTTDAFDRCPSEIEDRDGFQDQDGCPEPDNDADGVIDEQDRCPVDAEDVDGDHDDDGCPDISATASIDTIIYFEAASAEVRPEYRYELGRVARTIVALPAHLHVWIEGYADDSGGATQNTTLSRQRAQAVFDFLLTRGVDRAQIDIQAYGDRTPAYANESDADRHVNRRVEFRVGPRSVTDEGAPAPAVAPSEGSSHE